MAKKDIEDLDAELAALEAELQALEHGEAELPKKPKKARKAEPADSAPERAPDVPKRKLGLPKRAKPEGPDAEPAKPKLPFGRKRTEPAPPAPEPVAPIAAEPEEPALPWQSHGKGWTVTPPQQRIEVVRREMDAQGRVVREEALGEELEGTPEPASAPPPEPPQRFGFLGGADPEPGPEGAPPRRSRKRILIPVIILLAILVAAGALYALNGGNVGGGGASPTAAFRMSGNVVAVGAELSFDGDTSTDPSGGALEFDWDFGDGSGANGKEVDHDYAARGTYTVTLTVRNAAGKTASHSEHVTVLAPPSAAFALTLNGQPVGPSNPAFNGSVLTFDASASTADGGLSGFDWQFGDGARGSGKSTTHPFQNPGAYNVTLTVVDSNGLRGTTSKTVFVGSRIHVNGTLPASLQAPSAVNTTVPVLAHAVKVHAVLTFDANATGGLPPGLPGLPGAVNPNNLGLTLYSAAGAPAAAGSGEGSPKSADASNPAAGAWKAEVSRPQGGAQDQAYDLVVEVSYG